MKALRIPSLVLAAVLQMLPIARLAAIWQQPATPLWAILLRWAGSAAAALGGVQAVSGASTVITNPLVASGTNGVPFKQFRLTTAPDQAHYWTASGLPPGITLTGKSGQTFWALGGTPTSAGVFNVRLTAKDQVNSGSDRTISGTLVVTVVAVGTPPVITTQPLSKSVVSGNPVTLTVAASGTDPITYQWKKNDQNVSGGTSSSLSFPSVTTSDAGTYTVLVSNSLGSVLSQGATLSVTTPVAAPAITLQPVNQSVTVGASVTLSVAADGTPPLAYQWKKNGQDIANATLPSLVLASVTLADAGEYTVLVSNAGGAKLSQPATLAVAEAVTLPVIVSPPAALAVHSGQNATFSVHATGTEPLRYQWFLGTSELAGATTATLTLQSVDTSAAGDYSVTVSNSAGSVPSAGAPLTVTVLQIISCSTVGDSTVVTWNGIAGQNYACYRSDAVGDAWQLIPGVTPVADQGLMKATLPHLAVPGEFYRVTAYP